MKRDIYIYITEWDEIEWGQWGRIKRGWAEWGETERGWNEWNDGWCDCSEIGVRWMEWDEWNKIGGEVNGMR